jgi:hypothetical protein
VRLEELGQLKKSKDLVRNLNRDFPACSIVPQPTTLPHALLNRCDRTRSWPNLRHTSLIFLGGLGKARKGSAVLVGVQPQIRTVYFPNTNQKPHPLNKLSRYKKPF